jgi:hypothetical protein
MPPVRSAPGATLYKQPAPATPAVDPNLAILQQLIGMMPVQAPAVPAAPIMYGAAPAPDLTPEEVAYFDTLQTRMNEDYAQGAATNAYQQGILQSEHGAQVGDYNRRFDRMREQLPGQYQRRGLMNSGIYQQGLTDYATDRTFGMADLERRYQAQMGGLQMAGSQLYGKHQTGLATNETQKNARRQTVASTLRMIR